MVDSYTVYWSRDRVNALKLLPGSAVPFSLLFGGPHTSQPSFVRAGALVGDWLYPISVVRGRLQVLGRIKVRQIGPVDDVVPKEFLTHSKHSNDKWIAECGWPERVFYKALCVTCTDEVVLGEDGSGPVLDLYLNESAVRNLRYRNKRSERVPKGIETGKVTSPLAHQGIYRLAERSAEMFADIVNRRHASPYSGEHRPERKLEETAKNENEAQGSLFAAGS